MNNRNSRRFVFLLALTVGAHTTLLGQRIQFAHVTSKQVARTTELPGEFYSFLTVQVHAKVPSYVEKVYVDRGSFVKEGDLLVQLSAPEMMAHIAQAQAQLTSAESDEAQAKAQSAAAQSTYTRTQEAAKTPGAVAPNDVVVAKAQMEAAQSLVQSRQRTIEALRSNLKSLQDLASYLRVTAPFDGVISARFVHPGAFVGPRAGTALLQLDQVSHLRLAIAVPEADVAGIAKGARIDFKVPAYPDRTFSGIVARAAYVLDRKTRTMPVELDVTNTQRLLAPGMYPSVIWPVEQRRASLLVPSTSVVATTERVFVIRNRDGHAQWVDVRRGPTVGNLVQVYGDLKPGDEIVQRGTDEIRDGTPLNGSS